MFDLRRLVHLGRSTRQPVPAPVGTTLSPGEPVKLVAITQNPDDAETLQQIASNFGWRISIVDSSATAIASLNDQPTPLVICDRDLSGEPWGDVLARIAALPQAVCVLLASRVVDDYLWRQVIRHHGYDVVAKPFRPEDLRRAVTFAWSWRGWAHRHYDDFLRKPTA
jgi:DNA-binding NtrC family response regulator